MPETPANEGVGDKQAKLAGFESALREAVAKKQAELVAAWRHTSRSVAVQRLYLISEERKRCAIEQLRRYGPAGPPVGVGRAPAASGRIKRPFIRRAMWDRGATQNATIGQAVDVSRSTASGVAPFGSNLFTPWSVVSRPAKTVQHRDRDLKDVQDAIQCLQLAAHSLSDVGATQLDSGNVLFVFSSQGLQCSAGPVFICGCTMAITYWDATEGVLRTRRCPLATIAQAFSQNSVVGFCSQWLFSCHDGYLMPGIPHAEDAVLGGTCSECGQCCLKGTSEDVQSWVAGVWPGAGQAPGADLCVVGALLRRETVGGAKERPHIVIPVANVMPLRGHCVIASRNNLLMDRTIVQSLVCDRGRANGLADSCIAFVKVSRG